MWSAERDHSSWDIALTLYSSNADPHSHHLSLMTIASSHLVSLTSQTLPGVAARPLSRMSIDWWCGLCLNKHPVPLCCCRPHPRFVGKTWLSPPVQLAHQLLSCFEKFPGPTLLMPGAFCLEWPFSFPSSWPYLPCKFRFPFLWLLPLLRNFFLTCGSWCRAHPCCSASHCIMVTLGFLLLVRLCSR